MVGKSTQKALTPAEFVRHTQCAACGSSDANAVYDDGHTHCFSCGARTQGDESMAAPSEETKMTTTDKSLLPLGDFEPLTARRIDTAVCQKYGYSTGEFKEKPCHIAPYYDDAGKLVAQKVRLPGKDFTVRGNLKAALPLFGQQLCRDGGKMIVVTEGEIDALAVCQAMGLSWPAVSIPNGAQGAKKAIARAAPFLDRFDKVVFCFDEDEPGREALEECLPLISCGKAYVAKLPLKDASDMVKAGRSKELVDAIWGARRWSPEILNDIDDDLIEDAAGEMGWGLPWPWRPLTERTYGQRRSAVYTWGAGTGSGKTTLVKQLACCAILPGMGDDHSDLFPMPEPRPVATILYEEPIKQTLKTLAGMVMGKRIHVPGTEYDKEEAKRIMRELRPLLKSVSLKGARNWETVKSTIKYLRHAEGVLDFIIDPMTALTAGDENERQTLDGIMSELAGLAEELEITIHLVFHLATPEGKSHEDGGRVQEKHFRGSRAVAFWSHYLMGLERNKQDQDAPTIIRGLKDRLTGDAIGPLIALAYDRETGLMVETDMPEDGEKPFKDETDELF